jgi:apolipoprotein N-acyltransferase
VFHLTDGSIQVAPLICFEDTVGDLVRHFVLNGADVLADITNDGWFLHSAGSQQHLANAVFRCVENRRPMVRAANTGVTCFIDEFGRRVRATSHIPGEPGRLTNSLQDKTGSAFTRGVLIGELSVPQERRLTFYARHGELFAESCAVVTALTIAALFGRRWIGRSANASAARTDANPNAASPRD